jgi:hypothetical protein
MRYPAKAISRLRSHRRSDEGIGPGRAQPRP